MHKHLLVQSAAREKVLHGATALADAVRVTLGPRSKCVLIEKKWSRPIVCNDGVTMAKEFALEDHEENLGAQVIRQAAERTGDLVGDGTTTSTLLAGVRNIAAMTTISPSKSPLGLGSTAWTVIVTVLLVMPAALAVYFG
jgi:chaperonin GroEL